MKHLFELRKELHRIPEPAFNEYKTTDLILQYLKKYPEIKCHAFPFTGLIAEYTFGAGDYILFRADMDALPLQEKTDAAFASEHQGYMHACGHDIHMTILIGLIEEVISRKIKQNILFLFQPAEEGFGGAEKVLATGLLDRFPVKEAYALHVHPSYPVGTVASNTGILFGIPQEFDVLFKGKSAHAANPEKGKDAIRAACSFYQAIQQEIAPISDPQDIYLCHIGKIEGGAARNIVAGNCTLQGTLRALTKENMTKLKAKTTELAERAATMIEGVVELKFLSTYDPVVNSPQLYEKLKKQLNPGLKFVEVEPALLGEDFGFFTTKYEGLMFFIGADSPDYDLHSPYFLPPEETIITGIKAFCSLLSEENT